jgi:YbbR domain-containing protein
MEFIRKFFTKHIGLKIAALILALALWFYIVNELNKGTEEERQFLNRILPQEDMTARKLIIMPVFIGHPRAGWTLDVSKAVVVPEYCIVVGNKSMLDKVRFAYTVPVDISGSTKPFTKSVALNPIAPGVFTEETLVQVTIPIEKENP